MKWPWQRLTVVGLAMALSAANTLAADDENDAQELQTVVVSATRSGRLVPDEPVRVEVVPREEIEENLTVSPGTLTSLLNELAGARIQSTAPGLGGATLQLRGLPGRHVRVLSDGLPLAGGPGGAFGLLQTPPLDLAQVEVIKGVASALYGGSALSGVLNLVSRPPGSGSSLLLNASSLRQEDAVAFVSPAPTSRLGYSLIGGAHHGSRRDLDQDGWADLPAYTRYTLRPRLYWNDGDGNSLFTTIGLVHEDRSGGTLAGHTLPGGTSYPQVLHNRHVDAGAVASLRLDDLVLGMRTSAGYSDYERLDGNRRADHSLGTASAEFTLGGDLAEHHWIAGAAVEYERLHTTDVPGVGYRYTTPGLFVQDEYSPATWLSLAASARVDHNSAYGSFFSPRLSVLVRPDEDWSLRASLGSGFSPPTPLIDDVEDRGLAILAPAKDLRAERGRSASLDANWHANGWDINASIFTSAIRHPLMTRPASDGQHLELINSDAARRVHGAELLIGRTFGDLHLLASSTWLEATEAVSGEPRRGANLIPRFTAEVAGILEDEDLGRAGLELGYTGRQTLWDDPWRTTSRPYYELNALAELRVRRARIFVNAINLTNARQSHFDPLLRPAPMPTETPITDVWAPLVGRSFNLGIRLDL
jgi:iron complex outermembrane receptor protein